MIEKLKVLVLSRHVFQESDLILHLASPIYGRLSAIAKGARKSKKRFSGGVLEPSHYIEALISRKSQDQELWVLEEAKIIDDFSGLRDSYDRLEAGLWFLEVMIKILQPRDPSAEGLFDLVGHGLRKLSKGGHVNVTRAQFALKLLLQQGVLEREPWMDPYLALSMTQAEVIPQGVIPEQQCEWAEQLLRQYAQI